MLVTKYKFLCKRRDAILERQLCNSMSLRTVAVTCQHIDKILAALKSDDGWTDSGGEKHFADQLYMHEVDPTHIANTVLEGTPQAYRVR